MVYTIIGHFLSPMPFGVSLFTTEAVQQALGAKGLASPMPFGVSPVHHTARRLSSTCRRSSLQCLSAFPLFITLIWIIAMNELIKVSNAFRRSVLTGPGVR